MNSEAFEQLLCNHINSNRMATMEWYEAFIKLIGKEELIFQIKNKRWQKRNILTLEDVITLAKMAAWIAIT